MLKVSKILVARDKKAIAATPPPPPPQDPAAQVETQQQQGDVVTGVGAKGTDALWDLIKNVIVKHGLQSQAKGNRDLNTKVFNQLRGLSQLGEKGGLVVSKNDKGQATISITPQLENEIVKAYGSLKEQAPSAQKPQAKAEVTDVTIDNTPSWYQTR